MNQTEIKELAHRIIMGDSKIVMITQTIDLEADGDKDIEFVITGIRHIDG